MKWAFTAQNVENRAHSCVINWTRYHFKFVGERDVSGVVGRGAADSPHMELPFILQLELDPVKYRTPV
jgi:hypothetical protein